MEKLPNDYLPTDPLQLQIKVFSEDYLDQLVGQTLGNEALYYATVDEKAAAARVYSDPTNHEKLDDWRHARNVVEAMQSRTQQSPPSER